MKVLFQMYVFPDLDRSFNMYTSLVEEFHRRGHDVYVIAPHNAHKKTEVRIERGIKILRVKLMPVNNISNYLKGIANLLLPFKYWLALNKFFPDVRFELLVTSTPSVTLVSLVERIKNRDHSKVYLILRDIFPQNAVDLGLIRRNGMIHRYFRNKEKKLYEISDHIGCMSEGNINYLTNHNAYLSPDKLHILENFQVLNEFYPSHDLSIWARYSIENKFVVVFGGNMGKPQQLENVLALAEECKIHSDVVFLLLGDGIQKQRIKNLIKKKAINNVRVINTIPKDEYQRLIRACDLGLISLHSNFTIPNIPSKALDYFNLGIPVLASIDKTTDFGLYLDKVQAGLWSYAGDIKMLKDNFEKLYFNADLRKIMGANGRRYFEEHLTPDRACNTILSHL